MNNFKRIKFIIKSSLSIKATLSNTEADQSEIKDREILRKETSL